MMETSDLYLTQGSKNEENLDEVTCWDVAEIVQGQSKVNTGVKFQIYSNDDGNHAKLLLVSQGFRKGIVWPTYNISF